MAELQQKRLREESHDPISKRQKPNNVDQQEQEDLSAMFATLEQDLHFESPPEEDDKTAAAAAEEEDDGVKSVIRHLLEASDDELGIPNTDNNEIKCDDDEEQDLAFGFVDNGLWELEDVAANYYAILQSELFM